MDIPKLLTGLTEKEYKEYYERNYCFLGPIETFDNIPVYFSKNRFNHAFYRPKNRRSGRKDTFCPERAECLPWIKATLQNSNAILYKGWISDTRQIDPARRVAVIYENFIVIIELSLKKDNSLKANFVTAFRADDNLERVQKSPKWVRQEAVEILLNKKKNR